MSVVWSSTGTTVTDTTLYMFHTVNGCIMHVYWFYSFLSFSVVHSSSFFLAFITVAVVCVMDLVVWNKRGLDWIKDVRKNWSSPPLLSASGYPPPLRTSAYTANGNLLMLIWLIHYTGLSDQRWDLNALLHTHLWSHNTACSAHTLRKSYTATTTVIVMIDSDYGGAQQHYKSCSCVDSLH